MTALDRLGRALGLYADLQPIAQNVTVNQVHVGDVPALEVARRMAFLLANAGRMDEAAREPHG